MFEKVNKAYEYLCSSKKVTDGPDPRNIVLILKAQCILFSRYREGKSFALGMLVKNFGSHSLKHFAYFSLKIGVDISCKLSQNSKMPSLIFFERCIKIEYPLLQFRLVL